MDEAEHDVKEGASSSLPMELLNSNDNAYVPSTDDLEWADSCLTNFTEASDADWSSFKVSFLEMLNAPTEPVSMLDASDGIDDGIESGDNHTVPSGENVADSFSMMTIDHSEFTDEDKESVQEGEGIGNDDAMDRKKKEWLEGKKLIENALLPDHAEFAKVESNDLGFDPGFSTFEGETSSSDAIFQVWDLGVSNEQDEFTKALSSALYEDSSATVASSSGVTEGWQDLAVEPLDDLIAAVSELSLSRSS